MNNLAIIPARGGSKRIPRKNIKEFLGKPIIAYSIQVALQSELFEEVMVSTDDDEIADISKKYGATVPFLRSKENSDDYATLADVIKEVIDYYTQKNIKFDYGCCILPTSPLLKTNRLVEGFDLLKKKNFDSVKPIVKFSYPIQRALKFKNNAVEMIDPKFKRTRSQDIQPAYHDAGQFYWFKFNVGLNSAKKGALIIPEIEAQDIDTIEDWKIAEFKYKYLTKKKIE